MAREFLWQWKNTLTKAVYVIAIPKKFSNANQQNLILREFYNIFFGHIAGKSGLKIALGPSNFLFVLNIKFLGPFSIEIPIMTFKKWQHDLKWFKTENINPAYRRHWISLSMRILAQVEFLYFFVCFGNPKRFWKFSGSEVFFNF